MMSFDGVARKRGFVCVPRFVGKRAIFYSGSSALLGVRRGVDGLSCAVAREVSTISSCSGGVIVKCLQGPTTLLRSSSLRGVGAAIRRLLELAGVPPRWYLLGL